MNRWQCLGVCGLLSAALCASPAWARDGVDVGRTSAFTRLVAPEQVEQAGQQQYAQLAQEARAKGALAPANHPQLIRLKAIASRIIPYAAEWNPRSQQWRWEVNLLKSNQVNAFCMPGGKIAFYTGILEQLRLSDDEVAMVMGHEMAHALREHARERMGKTYATRMGASLMSSIFGLGNAGDMLLNMGGELLSLKFSREDESEADLVGMELAARAGYDPRAGISLWQKMAAASKGAPPEFMSTHPSGSARIQEIEAHLGRVLPLYERAEKPAQRFDVPRQSLGLHEGGLATWVTPPPAASQPSTPSPGAAQPVAALSSGGWVRVTPRP